MLEFQETHVFHQLLYLIVGILWEDSFLPHHSEPETVHLYQLQNTAVNPSNRQGIDKGERMGEAEIDGEAEKRRGLLGYTHAQTTHTPTQINFQSKL